MPCVDNQRLQYYKYTYVGVLVSYLSMRIMAHLCTRRGMLKNRAQRCTDVYISGRSMNALKSRHYWVKASKNLIDNLVN